MDKKGWMFNLPDAFISHLWFSYMLRNEGLSNFSENPPNAHGFRSLFQSLGSWWVKIVLMQNVV